MLHIELAPIFDRNFTCTDHFCGDVTGLGDELGCDVLIESFLSETGEEDYLRPYRNDGSRNEDWFTYGANVYSPISGVVEEVHLCPYTNQPGTIRKTRASSLTIRTADNLHVILAHIERPLIQVGEPVIEGQHVAYGGNNGWSHCPHIHLGAWRDTQPVAVCFDREKTGAVYLRVGRRYWFFGD